ncbi:MAG: cytochrome c-type biogenesis protein [Gammaproteobacteria bacterium]
MRRSLGLLLALTLSFACPPSGAADTPHVFADPAAQARYEALLEELRCLVCQNQSLADSHADLAQDLRDEVYRMVSEGRREDEIRDFMVARYGDFVLYRPPVTVLTVSLWFGPPLLLGIVIIAWRRVQRRAAAAAGTVTPLSDAERTRLAALVSRDPPAEPPG